MQCPQCAFGNPAGMALCGRCGTKPAAVCPSCGTANPEEFAFCGKCGSRLTGGPNRRRAGVTTMFREMDMRFWLEQAEADMKELG